MKKNIGEESINSPEVFTFSHDCLQMLCFFGINPFWLNLTGREN